MGAVDGKPPSDELTKGTGVAIASQGLLTPSAGVGKAPQGWRAMAIGAGVVKAPHGWLAVAADVAVAPQGAPAAGVGLMRACWLTAGAARFAEGCEP